MQEKNSFSRKVLSGLMSVLILFTIVSACNDDNDNANNKSYTISGDASGSQVVPAVTGSGTGTMTGTYNPTTKQLNYTTNWSGLTGAPTSGGFYSGASGTAGTAVGTPWAFQSGATGTGTMSGTMTLTDEQASQLTSGNWYYGYGTSANPGGEVRGQITATR